MSLVWTELHPRNCSRRDTDKGEVRTRQRRWRVSATVAITPDQALYDAQAPRLRSRHPSDSSLVCQSISATQNDQDRHSVFITAEYATLAGARPEEPPPQSILYNPAVISWQTQQYTAEIQRDVNGNAVLNSAGDPFYPPVQIQKSRLVAQVRKALSMVPAWLLEYRDAVNNAPFTLDGLQIKKGAARILDISISEWRHEGELSYREVSITIAVNDEADSWQPKVLDQGFFEKIQVNGNTVRRRIRVAGEPVCSPVLLDGQGHALPNPVPAQAQWITVNAYPEKDFSILPLT